MSSTFALMEALILIFLYRRNRHFDRWNALFHLPLVLQEGLQAVLWTHVERERDWAKGWDDEALHVCPKSNTVCTFLVLAVVGAVPAWFARCTQSEQVRQQSVLDGSGAPIWVQLVGPIEKESAEKLRGTLRILTVGQAVALLCMGYLYFVASGVPSQTSWIAMCTCKGPWGHQIWAFMSWPNKPLEVLFIFFYFAYSGAFLTLPRPSLIPQGFGFVNAVTIVLYLLMGPEAGSVWCWGASTLCVTYLAEPYLFEHCHVLEAEFLYPSEEAEKRRATLGFFQRGVFAESWAHLGLRVPWNPGNTSTGMHA